MNLRPCAALLIALAACASDPLTEVVVTVEPSPTVLARTQAISVDVTRASDGAPLYQNSSAPWSNGQHTLALAPQSERAAVMYRLEVTAAQDGRPIAVARLIAGYVLGETRYVRIRLEDTCSTACDLNSTCYRGACVDARVDPLAFAADRARAPESGSLRAPVDDGGAPPVTRDPPQVVGDDGGLDSPSDAAAPAGGDAPASPIGSVTPDAGGAPLADAGAAIPAAPAPVTPAPVSVPVPVPSATCTEPTAAACSALQRCDAGAVAGCEQLAAMYDTEAASAGFAKNDARAAALYERACGGGSLTACISLGLHYGRGRGVVTDAPRAVQLFTQGCDAGLLHGCDHLGWMLLQGLGVARDEPRALALFTRACDANVPSGCLNLGMLYKEGRSVPVDGPRALPLFVRSCDGGVPQACREAGHLLAGAVGVPRDVARARQFYARACDANRTTYADACTYAANLR